MKNLESLDQNINIESEPDPVLKSLWKKYNFPNRPPFKGSVAERRLKEVCSGYSNLVKNSNVINKNLEEDSENYFSKRSNIDGSYTLGYETKRRELHNTIAIMVVGEKRSGMNEAMALKIADFAMEYSSLN